MFIFTAIGIIWSIGVVIMLLRGPVASLNADRKLTPHQEDIIIDAINTSESVATRNKLIDSVS